MKCHIWSKLLISAVPLIAIIGCGSSQRDDAALNASASIEEAVSTAQPETETVQWPVYDKTRAIENSIIIGLDADMTSGAAVSGEAIRRGIVLALDEINDSGGLLGRPVELVVRDHRGNPERGIDNMKEFAGMTDVVAVVGGLHTPVALRELDVLHENQMIYLGPWAAGTPIVENRHTPNYVFRVSVRDEYAGGFLVNNALDRGLDKIGLLLERTGWGRSNETAMLSSLTESGAECTGVEWFNLGEDDMSEHLQRLCSTGAQAVLLVCNPMEGVSLVKAMASRAPEERLPIISHWGITGGNFAESAKDALPNVDLSFLQTHSFISPRHPDRTTALYESYVAKFGCDSRRDVLAPVGTAHAYDIVGILSSAVKRAGTIERSVVRNSLEAEDTYAGVMRDYTPPFRPDHHDALSVDDFVLARFASDGAIEVIEATRAHN